MLAALQYAQDYDETFPYTFFTEKEPIYVWKNAVRPYLKSLEVLMCPSNPFSRSVPRSAFSDPPRAGSNARGWQYEPEQRMPISYSMSSCTFLTFISQLVCFSRQKILIKLVWSSIWATRNSCSACSRNF